MRWDNRRIVSSVERRMDLRIQESGNVSSIMKLFVSMPMLCIPCAAVYWPVG